MSTDCEPQPLPTTELRLGMYVSRLDRPWLETPFLFQGFYIENEGVIEELRRYCKVVFVDTTRADRTLLPSVAKTRAVKRDKPKAAQERASGGEPGDDHRDTVVLKSELLKAREAHGAAERAVANMFVSIKNGEAIDLTGLHRTLDPMIDSIMRNEDALSWLVRMKKKDDYIYSHSIASSVWALLFGKHLGLAVSELHVLALGTIFMDVGKTKIPTELLTKSEALTPDEMALMKTHVHHGVAIVSKIHGIDARVVEIVKYHHERHNGTGYPRGLSGTAIPVFARIASVIDTYDAMTAQRPYAKTLSPYDATRQLSKLAGVEFPAEVIEHFIQAIGVFPVGTLVELNTGEVGMVIAQNRVRRLRPKIIVLLDRNKQPLDNFPTIDLRNQLSDASGQQSLWIERGLAPGDYGLDPTEYYLQDK